MRRGGGNDQMEVCQLVGGDATRLDHQILEQTVPVPSGSLCRSCPSNVMRVGAAMAGHDEGRHKQICSQ